MTRLTVTIIAWNEEDRLRACLESVAWADEIVVIDAESTDKTEALGTPSLGLFGPTRAERNGPYGPHGRGLQSPDGTMAGLAPDAALDAALEMLALRDAAP